MAELVTALTAPPAAARRPAPRPPAPRPARSPGARRAWTTAGLLLAATAVALWVTSAVSDEFAHAYLTLAPSQRTFTAPVRALTVDVASGSVTVEPGGNGGTVVATWGTSSSRRPTDAEHVAGHTLVVRSTCGQGSFIGPCERNYVLHVPRRVAVTVDAGTGAVTVRGIDGSLDLRSEDGDIAVTGGSGPVRATSGTGAVSVDRPTGSLDLSTDDGDIAVTGASGPVHATSGTGAVTATGLSSPSVAASSTDGDVALAFTAVPEQVTATSETGAVTVALPGGPTVYRVAVHSGTGSAQDLVASDPSSTRVVRATSTNGNVRVAYGPG